MSEAIRLLPGEVSQPLEDGLSARALLLSIRRHRPMVLVLTLALTIVGAAIGLGLPAWYKAEGVVVINSRPHRSADLQELPDPSSPEQPVIVSETDILQSRSVIEPVVRQFKLWATPEFQKREYPGGWDWRIAEARLRDLVDFASGPDDHQQASSAGSPPDDGKPPTQAQIDWAVEAYANYLNVTTDGRSMTIRVSYRAWAPERAAAIVNAHIDSYRNFEVKSKVTAAERANSALTAQVSELRKQLQDSETAVTRYREEHHLMGAAKDTAAVSQQLIALNNQLLNARAQLAESEARAARIAGGGESLPEVVSSGTMSALRAQEAQLVAKEADLGKYHGDEYPDLRRVRASLQNLREQISREIGRGRAAALQLVDRDRTRERSLQQSVTELTKQLNSSDAGLQQLQGKAESIRAVLHNFEQRLEETAANPAFITPNSTVASRANSSATLTSPKAPILAFAGGFVGFTLGGLLSLLFEVRDRTFRTSAQVEQQVRSLTVSATPRALGRQRKFPADIILNDNASVFAEAFRVSWANMQLATQGPNGPSFGRRRLGIAFGITSAASGEGKSTHALALARTAALAGESVVLVDADLRRSGVSRLLQQGSYPSLRDFLQDRCAASDVIAVEERSGVRFVTSVPSEAPWTSRELQRFFSFIDYLKDRFAIVMIDLPPILGLSETLRLAAAADSVALIIRWGRTERQFVQFALDALRSARVSARTVILNDVDLKAQQRRGYRDRSAVYTYDDLYRSKPTDRRASASAALVPFDRFEDIGNPGQEPEVGPRETYPGHSSDPTDRPAAATGVAQSDIQRLYDRYRG